MADHILVIDDELSMRELLGILLKRDGFHVTSCGTAEEGLEVMERGGWISCSRISTFQGWMGSSSCGGFAKSETAMSGKCPWC